MHIGGSTCLLLDGIDEVQLLVNACEEDRKTFFGRISSLVLLVLSASLDVRPRLFAFCRRNSARFISVLFVKEL